MGWGPSILNYWCQGLCGWVGLGRGGGGGQKVRGIKRSGVNPPLSSSRTCIHRAFLAILVPFLYDVAWTVPSQCAANLPELGQMLLGGIRFLGFVA